MQFQTRLLREAVAKLQPITSQRYNLAELGAITLTDNLKGDIVLSGTNLDIWMEQSVPWSDSADPETPFSISSSSLHDTLRYMEEFCRFTQEKNRVVLTSGSMRREFPLIKGPMPEIPENVSWSKPFTVENLPARVLKCLPFSSREAHRANLQSVFFSERGLVATDGRKLLKVACPIAGEANVPIQAAEMLAKEKGDAKCRFSDGLAEFSGESWKITTKLIEGGFPNLDPLFKNEAKAILEVNREELLSSVRFVTLGMDAGMDAATAALEGSTLLIRSHPSAKEPSSREINATGDSGHSWAASGRLLATCLSAFESERVTLCFTDMSNAIIEDGDTLAICWLLRI